MVSVIFCSQLVFILNIVSSHFVSILLIVRKNKTIFFFITFSSGLQPPKHAVLFYCLKLNLRIYTALNSCSTIWVIFYSCCATYILLIIQTRPKAAQTVYNQQSYARNYDENDSIIVEQLFGALYIALNLCGRRGSSCLFRFAYAKVVKVRLFYIS